MKVEKAIIFTNGMIMAFDEQGEQIPKCQGCILDIKVVKNLNKYCDEDTIFSFAKWKERIYANLNLKYWFKKNKEKK